MQVYKERINELFEINNILKNCDFLELICSTNINENSFSMTIESRYKFLFEENFRIYVIYYRSSKCKVIIMKALSEDGCTKDFLVQKTFQYFFESINEELREKILFNMDFFNLICFP